MYRATKVAHHCAPCALHHGFDEAGEPTVERLATASHQTRTAAERFGRRAAADEPLAPSATTRTRLSQRAAPRSPRPRGRRGLRSVARSALPLAPTRVDDAAAKGGKSSAPFARHHGSHEAEKPLLARRSDGVRSRRDLPPWCVRAEHQRRGHEVARGVQAAPAAGGEGTASRSAPTDVRE